MDVVVEVLGVSALLLTIFHFPLEEQRTMFRRSNVSPVTPALETGTNDPNGTVPGQGGLVQGFVFTKWLRLHLVDIITMAALGAVGLGVYYARELVLSCVP